MTREQADKKVAELREELDRERRRRESAEYYVAHLVKQIQSLRRQHMGL